MKYLNCISNLFNKIKMKRVRAVTLGILSIIIFPVIEIMTKNQR